MKTIIATGIMSFMVIMPFTTFASTEGATSIERIMSVEAFCNIPNRTLKLGASQKNSESLRNILSFYKEYRTINFGETYTETMDFEIGFGRKLKNDVKLFQKFNKLSQDGIVGPKTRSKILQFCRTEYPKKITTGSTMGTEITALVGQRIKLENTSNEVVVTQIYSNRCNVNKGEDVVCTADYNPVVGVNMILGGDAKVGEKVIIPGSFEMFGDYKISVIRINEQANPRTVTLKIEYLTN